MSLEAQRVYLSEKFTSAGIDLPVLMPNVQSNIPVNAPYGEFHIVSGGKPITIAGEGPGLVRNRYVGMVQLTIWVPEGKGSKSATTAGDKFAAIFGGKIGRDSAQQTYKFGYVQEFTPQVKTGYSCCVYRIPYTRDAVEEIQVTE